MNEYTFNLVDKERAEQLTAALNGKTFYEFEAVQSNIHGNYLVTVTSSYEAEYTEFLEFLLNVVADTL